MHTVRVQVYLVVQTHNDECEVCVRVPRVTQGLYSGTDVTRNQGCDGRRHRTHFLSSVTSGSIPFEP